MTSADGAGVATIIEYATQQDKRMTLNEANVMMDTYIAVGGDAHQYINDFDAVYGSAYAGQDAPSNVKMDPRAAEIVANAARAQAQLDEEKRVETVSAAKQKSTGKVTFLGKVGAMDAVKGIGTEKALTDATKGMTQSQREMIQTVKQILEEHHEYCQKQQLEVAGMELNAQATEQEKQAAKLDYIAMMADIDLSVISDTEEEEEIPYAEQEI